MTEVGGQAGWMSDRRRFVAVLVVVALAGLALRLAYVWFVRRGVCGADILVDGCPGDSWVYHKSANLLADGKGWISPSDFVRSGGRRRVPSVDHPPALIVVLAAFSWVGLKTWTAHQMVVAVLGSVSVVVAGLLGRDVFGPRVGIVAALLVAFDPNVWSHDGNVLSEGPSILAVLVIIWCCYRLWASPSVLRAVAVGAAVGVGMLVRPELGGLLVLAVAPVALGRRGAAFRQRVGVLVVAGLAALVVVAPWVGYNLGRFNHPVTLSVGVGVTLANANCDLTYSGELLGFWSPGCIPAFTRAPGADQSDDEAYLRSVGLDYIGAHLRRYPVVVAARFGRLWNLYRPAQGVRLDYFEGRPNDVGTLALIAFYPVVVAAAVGAFVVRRRRRPLSPLLAPIVLVTLIAMFMTFGQSRYRAPAEPALCLLAAVGIDGCWMLLRRRRGHPVADPTAGSLPATDPSATGPADAEREAEAWSADASPSSPV